MSDDGSKKREMPKWLGPLIFVFAVGVVMVLSNHSADTRTPEGLYVIADDDAYSKSIDQAKLIAGKALQRYQQGEELTQQELSDIKMASMMIDQANMFKPNMFGPYFLSGKAHAALGEYEKADEELKQGILNAQSSSSQAVMLAVIDAHFERSRVLYKMQRYQDAYSEATIAATAIPNAPDYLVARAKAALQIGREDVAKEETSAALALDPTNHGAKVLQKFFGMAAPAKK